MRKSGLRSTLFLLSLWITGTVSAQVQQSGDRSPTLEALLPDGEGKELVADYCTRCHSTEPGGTESTIRIRVPTFMNRDKGGRGLLGGGGEEQCNR